MTLVLDAEETLGGMAQLEEAGHWGWILGVILSLAPSCELSLLPVHQDEARPPHAPATMMFCPSVQDQTITD